jgi:hypothetical protein
MNWKHRAIGLAVGLAIGIAAVGVPVAHADFATLSNVGRFHAELENRNSHMSCDEQYRSFESRQLRPADRRRARTECERLVQEAAKAQAAHSVADTMSNPAIPAPR